MARDALRFFALLFGIIFATTQTCAVADAQPTPGGGLSVSPVRVDFGKDDQTATVEVSNPGTDPLTVQVRLFGWTTQGQEDIYVLSKDIGFSPAIFKLEPKMRQTVRLFNLAKPIGVEGDYRLFVDQLPAANRQSGVQMPVRMILPVFVAPAGDEPTLAATLKWTAVYDQTAHQLNITVTNTGSVHDKIIDLACVIDGVKHSVRPGLAGYALAGQSRSWLLPLQSAPKDLTIEARNESKPVTAHIIVTP